MELQKPFGIHEILNGDSADGIYKKCSDLLKKDEFSCRGLLNQFNVKVVCTTGTILLIRWSIIRQ